MRILGLQRQPIQLPQLHDLVEGPWRKRLPSLKGVEGYHGRSVPADLIRSMAMEERQMAVSYEEVRRDVLDAFFTDMRNLAIARGTALELVLGSTAYALEGWLEEPVERLILHVTLLVLAGDRAESVTRIAREAIASLLREHGSAALLGQMDVDGADGMERDLRVLGFLG